MDGMEKMNSSNTMSNSMDMGSMTMDLQIHFTCEAGPFFLPFSMFTSTSCGHMAFFVVLLILIGIGRHYFESYKTHYLLTLRPPDSLNDTMCSSTKSKRTHRHRNSISALIQEGYQASMLASRCNIEKPVIQPLSPSNGIYGSLNYGNNPIQYENICVQGINNSNQNITNSNRDSKAKDNHKEKAEDEISQRQNYKDKNKKIKNKQSRTEDTPLNVNNPSSHDSIPISIKDKLPSQSNELYQPMQYNILPQMVQDNGVQSKNDFEANSKSNTLPNNDYVNIDVGLPENSILNLGLSRVEKFYVTLHYIIGYTLSLLIMLLAMSFNGYIILALLIGEAIGHFLLASDLYHNIFSQSHGH